MNTHVFIVDKTTFNVHLNYLFAGTGAKESVVDFNNKPQTNLHPTTERNLVGMIADASRIRQGDWIIFYLQQSIAEGIYEGKFYGIFKATNDWSFLDNNDSSQYLKSELIKSLTFRTLITPHIVYPKGVTEWEALDEIKNIHSPNQMLWSLIYRKLKGNRGNTMITIYESERLCQLIRNKNNGATLNVQNSLLCFNGDHQEMEISEDTRRNYEGRQENIDILPRLLRKFEEGKAFEVHLQAYITKNIGTSSNENMNNLILKGATLEWLGNEVYCSVGMQKIDVLLSTIQNDQKTLIPIELKCVPADESNLKQLQRYIEWLRQYYIPNRPCDIQPILLTRKSNNLPDSFINSIKGFNKDNRHDCKNLKFIVFDVRGDDLHFEELEYAQTK
jgi:predicted RNA-binding protein